MPRPSPLRCWSPTIDRLCPPFRHWVNARGIDSPGAVANPVHFLGTKNAAGVYPDRRDAIIWERRMENAGVGWIAAIIIGGLAGWLAEKFMKSEMGLFMNIILGIIGAAVASAILSWSAST